MYGLYPLEATLKLYALSPPQYMLTINLACSMGFMLARMS